MQVDRIHLFGASNGKDLFWPFCKSGRICNLNCAACLRIAIVKAHEFKECFKTHNVFAFVISCCNPPPQILRTHAPLLRHKGEKWHIWCYLKSELYDIFCFLAAVFYAISTAYGIGSQLSVSTYWGQNNSGRPFSKWSKSFSSEWFFFTISA